jgi:hypothetical protein
MTERFDWNDGENVVVANQAAIAVQGDEAGDVLLRQEGRLAMEEDAFIDVRRGNVIALCKAMLSAAGLHDVAIVPVDEIVIVNDEGKTLRIPPEDLRKIDEVAAAMRLEEVAEQPRWERPEPRRPKDPTAADRKRRQRQKAAAAERDTVTSTVTQRDTVTTAPRLPAELDLLQQGGTMKPALTR